MITREIVKEYPSEITQEILDKLVDVSDEAIRSDIRQTEGMILDDKQRILDNEKFIVFMRAVLQARSDAWKARVVTNDS